MKQSASEILDRLPPQDLEAEKAVLGSVLLDQNVCDDLALIIRSPSDFYAEANRKVYEHLMALHQNGGRIDVMLLRNRLKKAGDLMVIGGAVYLAELAQAVPYAANAVHYARIVRDKAIMREAICAATAILQGAYNETVDAEEVISQAERAVFALRDTSDTAEPIDANELMLEAFRHLEKGQGPPGLTTGLIDLDRLLGGLRAGELIVLAARPGIGKSALAGTIVLHLAVDHKIPTLLFSLEMSKIEVAMRLLSAEAKVNGHKMRSGLLSTEDHVDLGHASAALSKATLWIDDRCGLRASQIASVCRRMHRKHKLKLVIIDYLQLLQAEDQRVSRHEQIAEMTRVLKGIAREVAIPVLCVAQLNRHAEDTTPKLSHLRESGAIEQDADVVLFLHREEAGKTVKQLNEEEAKGKLCRGVAEVNVAKNRHGPTNQVKLTWLAQYTRFESAATRPSGWEPEDQRKDLW